MDQVSPDLLLMIVKGLNSKEMVSVMRVERRWLQIIDENQALWRELVLPSTKKGWGSQALELCDRKSNSTLKCVLMDVAKEVESGPFVENLERSKDTLQVLEIKRRNYRVKKALGESLWKFPRLVDCRLATPWPRYYKLSLQLEKRVEDQEDDEGPSLRILRISNSGKSLDSHLHLLDNLVSLLLDDVSYDSSEMRNFLERPSRTLKHLQFWMRGTEQPQLSTLSFPNLRFLDIDLVHYSGLVFPSWMSFPSLSSLIIRNSHILSSLPACSKLWLAPLNELSDLLELSSQCPELVQLTMDLSPRSNDPSTELPASERFENLLSMLNQRKANVENGMEFEGVKMINLKTLLIPFQYVEFKGETGLKEVGLSRLRGLVEEVTDARGRISENSEIIEMYV